MGVKAFSYRRVKNDVHHRIHRLLERLLIVEAGQLDRCRTILFGLVRPHRRPLIVHGEVDDHLLFANQEDHPHVLVQEWTLSASRARPRSCPPDRKSSGIPWSAERGVMS